VVYQGSFSPKISTTTRIFGRRQVPLPRRTIFVWVTVILFSNYLLTIVRDATPLSLSLSKLLTDLVSVSLFQYLAWFAVFRLLVRSDPKPLGDLRDFCVSIALCLLIFLPAGKMIWVVGLGFGTYLWLCNSGDRELNAAGVMLGGLAAQAFLGHIFFNLLAAPLLSAETAVMGTILAATRTGTVWHNNTITGPDGFGIIIYGACSSFHNLSLALLGCLTFAKLRNPNWQRGDFARGLVISASMILLNWCRLYMMALNVDLYDFWHDGAGTEIFEIAAAMLVLFLSLWQMKLRAGET
jgi:hypothetical protein